MAEGTAVDVLIVIRHDVCEPDKTCVYTNGRPEALEEILSAWLQNEMGRGRDETPFARRDVYTIEIGLVLENDSFFTKSDTGNKGLTCGIVMDALRNLKKFAVKPLSERPKPT